MGIPWSIASRVCWVALVLASGHSCLASSVDYQLGITWGQRGTGDGDFLRPMDVAVAPNGRVYVTDWEARCVKCFTREGTHIATIVPDGTSVAAFGGPCGVAVDHDGMVYVADDATDRVVVISPANVVVGSWSTQTGSSFPFGIAVDNMGYVYVVDVDAHKVRKFTTAGVPVTAFGSFYHGPMHCAVDPNSGHIYIGDIAHDGIPKVHISTRWTANSCSRGVQGAQGPTSSLLDL